MNTINHIHTNRNKLRIYKPVEISFHYTYKHKGAYHIHTRRKYIQAEISLYYTYKHKGA